MNKAAPLYTVCTSSPVTISSGSIIVYGITMSSTVDVLGHTFTFREGDGVTPIDSRLVAINRTEEFFNPFLADRGLVVIGATTNTPLTVYYSNTGV